MSPPGCPNSHPWLSQDWGHEETRWGRVEVVLARTSQLRCGPQRGRGRPFILVESPKFCRRRRRRRRRRSGAPCVVCGRRGRRRRVSPRLPPRRGAPPPPDRGFPGPDRAGGGLDGAQVIPEPLVQNFTEFTYRKDNFVNILKFKVLLDLNCVLH